MAETLLIVFVILVVLGMPIGFALGAGTLAAASLYPALNPIIIPTRLVGLLSDSFIILAAPLFILAGNIAARGGIARAIIDLATVLVGRFRGGLAYVNIVDSMIFGGISGSAVADVSALGTFLIPQMVRKGYDKDFATVLTISTAVLAPIVPPSIIAVLYAWLADESVAAIFAGGYIPGAMIALGMAVPTFVIARRRNYPREPRPTLRSAMDALGRALPGLMIPVIIMGGILAGVFTPTEAAAVAVVYALIVELWIYRALDWKQVFRIAEESAVTTVIIFVLLAMGSLLSYFITLSDLQNVLVSFIGEHKMNWVMFLLVINAIFFVAGMFIDPNSILLVLVPTLFPVATSLGIDPVHFGLVVCLNICIGMITPPFGLDLFVASGTLKRSVETVIAGIGPFIAVNVVVLAIISYVPAISTALPKLLL